jgi:lysophospholipase L1-like esterase
VNVHARHPEVPIYFLSIKPQQLSPQWRPAVDQTNPLVRDYCGSDVRLHFIDGVPAMLDAERRPGRDIFERDGIHLNTAGYRILTAAVKPILMDAFQGAVPIRTGGER